MAFGERRREHRVASGSDERAAVPARTAQRREQRTFTAVCGGVWEVSRRCLGGVSEVFERCPGGVWEVSPLSSPAQVNSDDTQAHTSVHGERVLDGSSQAPPRERVRRVATRLF